MDVPVGIVLRVISLVYPGYLHPDEYFQSSEVMAKEILGYQTFIPWEYSCENGGRMYRSIVSPYISSGFAFWLFKQLGWENSGYALFMAPRLVLFVFSLFADYLVWSLFGQRVYYVYRTSWVTTVLLTRPTSNTLETFILLLAYYCAERRLMIPMGVACAFGVFNRITFPAFALPVVFHALFLEDLSIRGATSKKEDSSSAKSSSGLQGGYGQRLVWSVVAVVKVGLGFLFGAAFHVLADSMYVASHAECTDFTLQVAGYKLVVTPLNGLLYNMDVGNLAQHGIHPRTNHLLVNMQMLFSPVWILALLFGPVPLTVPRRVTNTMKAICFLGLLILSIAPHQEARFLLPLIVPISLLMSERVTSSPAVRHFWKAFNILVGLFFGLVHQGGVVRSILALENDFLRDSTSPLCVATYESYMAPRFLLANQTHNIASFVDLGGMEPDLVEETLKNANCPSGDWFFILPTPAVSDFGDRFTQETLMDTYWPHFSGERMADAVLKFNLEMHRVKW